MTLSIDQMFAFIAVDDDGEGITGFKGPMGWMPMVGADMARIDSFREIAQELSNVSGKRIVIAKFDSRTDLEVIEPDPNGPKPGSHMVEFDPENPLQ